MSQSIGSTRLVLIFRILVILQLISLIVVSPLYGVYLDFFANGATEINVAGNALSFLLRSTYVIVLLILYLSAYVALLWFKRWARTLLAVAMALSLLEPFLYRQGYSYTGIEETLGNLSDYIDGALLALALATELRFRFTRRT
jgi:hypothetical protein